MRHGIGYTLMGPNISGGSSGLSKPSSSTAQTNPQLRPESQRSGGDPTPSAEQDALPKQPIESTTPSEVSHKLYTERLAESFVKALNGLPAEGIDTP